MPRLGRLCPSRSVLLLCDLQERFRPHVHAFGPVLSAAARLRKGCQALGVPVLVTEQRPEALGPTVPELGVQDLTPHPKSSFSGVPVLGAQLSAHPQLSAVLLCGIEAQACVLQTALDLLERGLDVHVAVDACSSRSPMERAVALQRLQASGAFLGTSESLLLGLLRDSAHPRFRQVLELIKEPIPNMELLQGGPWGF
ncbi:isochorismatase domain-containing protein 2 [Pezoporus occidentalis]|uniref:isochorismatase domain-containing protein 2 n=1 Tax=Pezoporus occidentalis TaxID=407982 RepID=UPI002F90B40D